MGAVVVLGGRSEIGLAVATRLAAGGARTFVLAARRSGDLLEQRQGLLEAGATVVDCVEFDADDVDSHGALIAQLASTYGIDTALVCFGLLGDQGRAEIDAAHALAVVHTDYVAQVSVLTHLARTLRAGAAVSWWCSPRSRERGFGGRTTCTARRRPASTGSPAVWPMRCTARASTCCWCGQGS